MEYKTNSYKVKINDINLSYILDLWLINHKYKIKKQTYDKYYHLINKHIKPYLGDILISQISIKEINIFLQEKTINGNLKSSLTLSNSYIKTMVFIIKSAINNAVKEDLCDLPKHDIYIPETYKKEPKVLSLKEQKQLEQYLLQDIDMSKLGILVCLNMGLRIGDDCVIIGLNRKKPVNTGV